MSKWSTRVLFEREGDTPIGPEVGYLVEPAVVEFSDGEQIRVQDGDYLDVVDRSAENWSDDMLRLLNRAIVESTERRIRHLKAEGLL